MLKYSIPDMYFQHILPSKVSSVGSLLWINDDVGLIIKCSNETSELVVTMPFNDENFAQQQSEEWCAIVGRFTGPMVGHCMMIHLHAGHSEEAW